MNREIAIRYCDEYLARHIADIDKEFLIVAKEALQQEPCDKCVYSTREGCQYDDITETIPPFETPDYCVSRQAVEEMIKAEMPERGMWEIEGDKEKETVCEVCVDLIQKLSQLPHVTPKQKTGHWIETAEEYYKAISEKGGGVNENTPYFTDDIACSECLAKFSVIDNETQRFKCCPNCGVKMVEPQEGGDQE